MRLSGFAIAPGRVLGRAAILPALKALFHADVLARKGKGSRVAVRTADAALAAPCVTNTVKITNKNARRNISLPDYQLPCTE